MSDLAGKAMYLVIGVSCVIIAALVLLARCAWVWWVKWMSQKRVLMGCSRCGATFIIGQVYEVDNFKGMYCGCSKDQNDRIMLEVLEENMDKIGFVVRTQWNVTILCKNVLAPLI